MYYGVKEFPSDAYAGTLRLLFDGTGLLKLVLTFDADSVYGGVCVI